MQISVNAVSTHSRLKAAGERDVEFLTRLAAVSTHSRLKAAGREKTAETRRKQRFNTQPPEGGWRFRPALPKTGVLFPHPAAGRRLVSRGGRWGQGRRFQHTAA